jgi:meiotic recombination protein SPO11
VDRNIFYQNVELFKSQGVVDDLVDNLAYTLGLGREDLNIVRCPPLMVELSHLG